MRIIFTLVLSLVIILNFTEISFESLPKRERIDINHSSGRSSSTPARSRFRSPSPRHPSAEFAPDRPSSSVRSSSSAKSRSKLLPSRDNSTKLIIPPTRLPSNDESGYGLEHMEFIQLIPNKNPRRIFKLQRYTFPDGLGLKLRQNDNIYSPMTTQEQIVISTFDDDVFAILENTYVLAGIYIVHGRLRRRVKINIKSRDIEILTPAEINEVPVGSFRPILRHFEVKRVKNLV